MQKLKYQEKLRLAKQAVEQVKKGQDLESINAELREGGLYEAHANQVLLSAKNILADNYGEKIKAYLLAGTFDAHQHEFEFMDSPALNNLKERMTDEIVANGKKEVMDLARAGHSQEDIIAKINNPFLDEATIINQIGFYKNYNVAPKGEEKLKFLVLGIGGLVIGIGLIYYFLTNGGRIGIGIFIAAFGGFNLYKAFTPKGVAEMSSMNDRFG